MDIKGLISDSTIAKARRRVIN